MSMLLAAALMVWMGAGASAELPQELAFLKDLAGDEGPLIEAIRAFDKEQSALAEAELGEAAVLQHSGKADAAIEKHAAAVKRFQLVKQAYEYALKQYRNNAKAQTYYGELMYDRFGETAAALAAWHLAISLDPKMSAAYNDLAIHYCHEGEYNQGLRFFDEAIKLEPDNPDYLFNLAQAYLVHVPAVEQYRKWKKPRIYKEAMKLSEKATRLDPNDYSLAQDYAMNFYKAEDLQAKPDWKGAAAAWARTRALAPGPMEVHNAWLNEARS